MPRPVHFEIHGSDTEALREFYGTLFGWKFEQFGGQPYWVVTTGKDPEAGIDGGLMPRGSEKPQAGASPNAWVVTVMVDDCQDYLDKATEAGGTVAMPKESVPGMGWVGYAMDPDGNLFGLFQVDESAS